MEMIKRRERLRRYEEGKIVHNNSAVMMSDLKDRKLLKKL
jgi:hypothetical protein